MRYLVSTLVIFIMASCSKYEEGPGISFVSKTERVSNTWEVESAYNGDENITSSYDEYTLQLLFDGDASLAALYSLGSLSFEFETNGTWEFVENKEEIYLNFEDDDADRIYIIQRLKQEELWLREKGTDVQLKLIPTS